MKYLYLLTFFLLWPAQVLAADEYEGDGLESENRRCLASDSKYESSTVGPFWQDVTFMRQCAPAKTPLPLPFDIFVTVGAEGQIEKLDFIPETEVGRCMRRFVADRKLPKPPYPGCVVKIKMSFKP